MTHDLILKGGRVIDPSQKHDGVLDVAFTDGKVSGFVSVNFPNRAAVHAVSSLLGEQFTELNSQVVDGVGEITNMITGGIKSALATTQWAFSQITVPSVIVGRGYSIAYAKGLTFLSVTFEHDDKDAMLLEDRLIQISISLLTL